MFTVESSYCFSAPAELAKLFGQEIAGQLLEVMISTCKIIAITMKYGYAEDESWERLAQIYILKCTLPLNILKVVHGENAPAFMQGVVLSTAKSMEMLINVERTENTET